MALDEYGYTSDTDLGDVLQTLQSISSIGKAKWWVLADAYDRAKDTRYEQQFDDVFAKTRYSKRTLDKYLGVARQFPPERRRKFAKDGVALDIKDFECVRSLDTVEQDFLLNQVVQGKINSREELRHAVKGTKPPRTIEINDNYPLDQLDAALSSFKAMLGNMPTETSVKVILRVKVQDNE